MSRNYFIMRQQLKDFGVELSDNASDNEIKEKFYNLPITEGQIIELKKLGVSYKAKMQWTRGFAKDFIRKGTQHFRAREAIPASPWQLYFLMEQGISVSGDMSFGEAAKINYNLPPEEKQLKYLENNKIKPQKGIELTYGYAYRLIKARERVIFETKASKIK